jgi:signal peptidase
MASARRRLGAVAVAAVLGFACLVLVPAVIGWERYVITTGSMAGAIEPGALVLSKPTKVSELRRGDVITYVPPAGHDVAGLVTHRIDSIARDARGRLVFRTKGDANERADTWTFDPRRSTLPRAVADVPHVGRLYAELTSPRGRFLVFVLPALVIAAAALASFWRESGAREPVRS